MDLASQRAALIKWYRNSARELPWRSDPLPWPVLVSEFMLQQTQVKTVLPRFAPFLERFPDPQTMALAGEAAVISAWAGLGYYRRARALFAAATAIDERHQGKVPGDLDALLALPGVGTYTAAAIGSIAFGLKAAVVDGNVERVLARLRAVDEPLRRAAGKRRIQGLADDLLNRQSPGDHNQAMMELGARVCTPRQPSCAQCPLSQSCVGQARWSDFPVVEKKARPTPKRFEGRVLLIDPQGRIAWRRRPSTGLYANLPDLPDFEVAEGASAYGEATAKAHTMQRLSHRELHLDGLRVPVATLPEGLESGPVGAFLAEGPPTPVARLVRLLQDAAIDPRGGQSG